MKYLRVFLFSGLVIGFIIWQLYFLRQVFDIDLLARPILPDGICKDCNVILISLDTLRSKSLPCYGYEKNTAPNLCEFAAESFLFKNAYSPASRTLDSHFSIFTGLYPQSHGMNIIFVSNLSEEIKTLTQMLKENGYKTLYSAPLSDPHLPLKKGLEKGFDITLYASDSDDWIKNLKESDLSGNKFFAFLHTYDVHEPYIPKKENISLFYNGTAKEYISWQEFGKKAEERVKKEAAKLCEKFKNDKEYGLCTKEEFDKFYGIRMSAYWDTFKDMDDEERKIYVRSLYEAKIYELDLRLKELFDYLEKKELLKNTVIVITSDHGEEFFEHGGKTHAETLYNEVIKVPLIIYVPNTKPSQVEKLASSVDILPTVLSSLGIRVPTQAVGINLFSKKQNKFVLAEHVTQDRRSIIFPEWKLILNKGRKELYNLKADFNEENNIIGSNERLADQMEKTLRNYQSKQEKYPNEQPQPFPTWIDEEQRKKLIETGYF